MTTYKITYELQYPTSNNDIRVAYVLADDISSAWKKVESREKGEYERAYLREIQVLDALMII